MRGCALAVLTLAAGSVAIDRLDARQAGVPETVALEVPGGKVEGTLLLPAAASGKTPVLLIVAGSGPTDRDGNSAMLPGPNNSLRLLAEALAADGIASLRYDKRGIGASKVADLRETNVRFETLAGDAASWVSFLRNDSRFSRIIVAGHSEGSLLGMLAARAARADAYVSIAGIARSAPDVIRDQLRTQLTSSPELLAAANQAVASLEAGKTVETPPPALAALLRPSVQPYLISWFKFVPAVELARLTVPVLLIQGTTDIQVSVDEVKALHAAKPDARLFIAGGMNHVLKSVSDPAKQMASYSDPTLPIDPDLPKAIAEFVRALEGPGMPQPRRPTGQRVSLRDTLLAEVDGARVAIEYGRPSKRGRVIWGALVPWGRWWMPGADESTTLTTSATLVFGDLVVPAGEYTIYTIPGDRELSLVINRETGQYHTVYNASRDLGRVPMTLEKTTTSVERMTFAVGPRAGGGGALKLIWDDREYLAPFVVRR
jgi:pimeloyl-ACP methyl ester carboxylesterase